MIVIPLIAYLLTKRREVLWFWTAYILTRPLGASFADWLAVPPARGGLDLGAGTVSLVLAVVVVALVGYLAATRRDVATS